MNSYLDYRDKWGRYHDKPCTNGEPSSNNGWIYTAYAQKLGFPIARAPLLACFKLCKQAKYYIRSPYKSEPVMSRDEILGLYALNLLSVKNLKSTGWSFSPYPIPSFNPFKTITALWRMRKAHRNALWENGGEPHLFRFAFSVPIQDRAWMLRTAGEKVPVLYKIYEFISRKVKPRTNSAKLIDWLKYGNEPDLEVFEEYFGFDHPFVEKAVEIVK